MEVTFEDNGSPLKKSKNRHGETCEEQLIRMCKNIADSITNSVDNSEHGEQASVASWMDGVYDIEWITHQDKTYKAARLLVAGGGPNIWVNLDTKYVEGYWGGDKVTEPFIDNLGLDDFCEEMYGC